MAGQKYTGTDKKVSKMTKEGLTEENLRDGSISDISSKSRDRPSSKSSEFVLERDRLKLASEDDVNISSNQKQKRMQRYVGKFREQGMIPEDNTLTNQKEAIHKKKTSKRMTAEQARSRRLTFEDVESQMVRGAGMGIGRKTASTVGTAVSAYAHGKLYQEADDNSAVEAAHSGEIAVEAMAVSLRQAQLRNKRADVKADRRGYRMDEDPVSKLKFGTPESLDPKEARKAARAKEERKNLLNRFLQRKKYKDAYRAAKAGKNAGVLGGATTIAGVDNMTVKAKIALKEIVRRNRTVFIGIGIFLLLFMLIAASLSSCSAVIQGGASAIGMTTYASDDSDIYAAENAYAELEEALNRQINNIESTYSNYDSFQYNITEIGHNPYHLISYLTAKYGGFRYEDVEAEIRDLFEAQYHLSTEGRTETVTETKTVRVGESLGNVVTSGYCSCSICCGVWSGGPTASGAYPTSNHTIAVDANNPIVPIGTKVVMNGVEYTVEDTGNFARYGVDFDVYYDSHAAASAHGHKTWEAFLADSNGSQEVTVTNTSTKRVLYVTLASTNFDAVARANLTEEQLILYDALNRTLGNRDYLWDVSTITTAGGMSYDIPPEALSDERFARMIREAEKYLGYPYVWGGSSPSTSFDCSGFVCWVVNHSGNGWNVGRTTADGLRSACTYVSPSEAKPGDLIFFQGTYNTSGASHVGIYVGEGMMIHCGDPISYANVNSSYWQSHFMCYGRLP